MGINIDDFRYPPPMFTVWQGKPYGIEAAMPVGTLIAIGRGVSELVRIYGYDPPPFADGATIPAWTEEQLHEIRRLNETP